MHAAFIIFLALACASSAQVLSSLSPKDRTITSLSVLILKGEGPKLSAARVNGISIGAEKNSFTCGLVLAPGKNFSKIEAWDKWDNYQIFTRKILRIITYPDVEVYFNYKTHWARNSIVTLSTLGIIEGFPDGNFYLNKSLTRGELASWICRAEGYKTSIPLKDVSNDVPKEHWRAPFIKEIIDRKIMLPDASGNFGVDLPIARSEAAMASLNAEGATFEKEIVSVFYDVPKDYPYYSQITNAKEKGLIRGISWKTAIFEPEREITRAEAAVLLTRFPKVKGRQRWLLNFNEGYSNYCKINTPPKIKNIAVVPDSIALNGGTPVILEVKIEDREADILNVLADISSFGGPQDAEMSSDGGVYTLQFAGSPESTGEKMITVTATDKLGWQGKEHIKVLVTK